MKQILKNLFSLSKKTPPKPVLTLFNEVFPDSRNAEWSLEKDTWEVVFHHDNREKIAKFGTGGNLIEIRTNLALSELPEEISSDITGKGEIMNAISIKKDTSLSWEIIYRDKQLNRFVCQIDASGKEIGSTPL